MATKKAVAKKTAVPAKKTVGKKVVPTKAAGHQDQGQDRREVPTQQVGQERRGSAQALVVMSGVSCSLQMAYVR